MPSYQNQRMLKFPCRLNSVSYTHLISKISAERNGDTVLTPLEVEEYCGQDVQELIFLLSTYDNTNYTYDRQLDLFVIGNNSIQDQVTQYVENLPDVVRADKLPEILKDANEDEDIPTEMLEKAFLNAYRSVSYTHLDVYKRQA